MSDGGTTDREQGDGLSPLVTSLAAAVQPRANSLIVTVFGDSVAPHGGAVWLTSLARLVEPLGLGERLVRTAVNRLAREGWLEGHGVGRRRFYALTPAGRRRFERATRRIYAAAPPPWDGRWTLVATGPAGLAPPAREALRRDLEWQGFAALAPGLYAHPTADRAALHQTLAEHGAAADCFVFDATAAAGTPAGGPAALTAEAWDLAGLAGAWQQFLDRFSPVRAAIEGGARADAASAFAVRSLLIHEYRRVMLRDPGLPDELLPEAWPGRAARALCAALYQAVWRQAETRVTDVLETAEGPLPEADASFHARFGGLDGAGTAERTIGKDAAGGPAA